MLLLILFVTFWHYHFCGWSSRCVNANCILLFSCLFTLWHVSITSRHEYLLLWLFVHVVEGVVSFYQYVNWWWRKRLDGSLHLLCWLAILSFFNPFTVRFLSWHELDVTVPSQTFSSSLLSTKLNDMLIGQKSDFSQSRCQLYCTCEATSIVTMFQRLRAKTSADQTVCPQRYILLLVLRFAASHVGMTSEQ